MRDAEGPHKDLWDPLCQTDNKKVTKSPNNPINFTSFRLSQILIISNPILKGKQNKKQQMSCKTSKPKANYNFPSSHDTKTDTLKA